MLIEKTQRPPLLIFFATGKIKGQGLAQSWPATAARLLTFGQFSHITVGYDGAVMDPQHRHVRYYSLEAVVRGYPALGAVVRVPARSGIDLDWFADWSVTRWSVFVRWLFGRTRWLIGDHMRYRDCLLAARLSLWAAGIEEAKTLPLVSPDDLYIWLTREKSFPYVLRNGFTNELLFRDACRQLVAD